MPNHKFHTLFSPLFIALAAGFLGCGAPPANVSTAGSNANTFHANSNTNSDGAAVSSAVESREPDEYQATVTLKVQALGNRTAELPTLSAVVAKKGDERRMEFNIPAGGHVVYLDKGPNDSVLILPDKKQFAELTPEALGFEIRRMMTPGQLVDQAKSLKGVQRVGEETYNGRAVVKYKYAAVANTESQAGDVATDSFLYVDKATGLPLHSETVSQSQSGGNVQGYNGLRVITEISDIKTDVPEELFTQPADYQKIDAAQVKAQVNLVFNVIATLLTQALKNAPAANTAASPAR
jgi:hypothetical protein